MRRIFIVFLAIFSTNGSVFSQASLRDSSINMGLVYMSYTAQLPGGSLSDRFGYNSAIGLAADFKLKNYFSFGLSGTFMFGTDVKEDPLASIRNSYGDIIDINGDVADVLMFERGFTVTATAGWLLPKLGPNPNSGILFKAGTGYLQHKIRIEANRNNVPQIQGEYVKGYDRLTSGISFTEFIGYQYLSNRRLINFFAGIELVQGFTKSRRDYQFDLMSGDKSQRIDVWYGIRAGWVIPIYQRPPKQYYFNK
ncbi:MAG: hypothetical protein ACOZCO_08160 [Bacteroidota bacterium]